jgi:hypothetical protein
LTVTCSGIEGGREGGRSERGEVKEREGEE